MARTYVWERGLIQSPDFHTPQQAYVNPPWHAGDTLIRTRFQIVLVTVGIPEYEALPIPPAAFTLFLYPSSSVSGSPYPYTNPSEDYLWYEGFPWREQTSELASPRYVVRYGPFHALPRDCKAQRKIDVDSQAIGWTYEDSDHVDPALIQVTYEILYLTAP